MNIYNNLLLLLQQYVYGGAEFTPYTELVATTLATLGCLFLVALPFLVVWKIIKVVVG